MNRDGPNNTNTTETSTRPAAGGMRSMSSPSSPSITRHKRSLFWKRHTEALPGSVKVIGARYSHAEGMNRAASSSGLSTLSAVAQSASSKTNALISATTAAASNFFGSSSNRDNASFLKTANDAWDGREAGLSEDGGITDQADTLGDNAQEDNNEHSENMEVTGLMLSVDHARLNRFKALFEKRAIDIANLRELSWNGIPSDSRSIVWQILLGYVPCEKESRKTTLTRKRKEYADYIDQLFRHGFDGLDEAMYHQVHIDIPRTAPNIPLFKQKKVQDSLEKVLYCWAIRHPASGYVQGINDLVTPFYYVFLSSYLKDGADVDMFDVDELPDGALASIEADSFWCLSRLLDGIQDHYTQGQPGILRQIKKLSELVQRIDAPLYEHLQSENVEFLQFSFRWMNCLLMRELPMRSIIRMWDTYLAEGEQGFSEYHLYVCAAFLVKWSQQLQDMDFQDCIMFLQGLPTERWGDKDVELILSEAFMWKSLFHEAQGHLS